jgi:hypothetical protein
MARLSMGQKAIVLGVMGLIGVLAIVVFVSTGLIGKALAVLLLGTTLSAAYKIRHL